MFRGISLPALPALRSPRRLAPLALLAACAVTLGAAANSYAPPAGDALAVELFALGHDKRTHYVDTATKVTWGRAQIFVDAPMRHVKAAITDYGSWSVIIPRFKKSKVLSSNAKGTEVYLQIPILKGAVTLWGVERFSPAVAEGKGERIVGKLVQGNVEDLQAAWHYRPVDEGHTIVTLEMYLETKLAVPESVMVGQRELACGEAVVGVRDRAQELARSVATKKP